MGSRFFYDETPRWTRGNALGTACLWHILLSEIAVSCVMNSSGVVAGEPGSWKEGVTDGRP